MTHAPERPALPVVLSIAGSDSGGGAGIQADLKTFTALGCFGTSALTCITAQNPDEVNLVEALRPSMVTAQIRTVCSGFPVVAAKTGMLFSVEIVEAVADGVKACAIPNLVIDPVMVATSGARLLQDDAVDALCVRLLPQATVITPNVPEAQVLAGCAPINSREAQRDAALAIAERFDTACVVKGGHLPVAQEERGAGEYPHTINMLAVNGTVHDITAPWVDALSTHGTGCTFAAAVAAHLAHGRSVEAAVRGAGDYVAAALAAARPAGKHHVMMPAGETA